MSMNIILTGATGMVGEGVLNECLHDPHVIHVLLLIRKSCGMNHPKVKELVVADLMHLDEVTSSLSNIDACLFCLGTTSVGKSEEIYYKVTYELTLYIANILKQLNPGMVFCYISGTGTDSTEKGRISWARTKGKTENDLKKLGFKSVYNFRPGYLQPTPGMKNTLPYYAYISWIYPFLKWVFPGGAGRLSTLGQAMIEVCDVGYEKDTIEVRDIDVLAATRIQRLQNTGK
ncbi:MAG: NAD-dependent epimerase/dehydratase family protein [Saprospiraceae bacterium]|nr:NAD-dependent epimerase/dehydratase family protein [Saprospiraceae bacterium]